MTARHMTLAEAEELVTAWGRDVHPRVLAARAAAIEAREMETGDVVTLAGAFAAREARRCADRELEAARRESAKLDFAIQRISIAFAWQRGGENDHG